MDWIKTILDKHTKEDGTVDSDAANKEIDAEFPKNAVPKSDFNSKVSELNDANKTLQGLKDGNKDIEALQTSIADYESKVEQLETEKAEQAKKYQLEIALKDAGGTDLEYLQFKLGDSELNEDGTIKDFDNKLKGLKESHPSFFESAETNKKDENGGFKVHDNKLDGGAPSKLTKKYIYEQYPKDKEKRIELLKQLEKDDK
ncbi:phage scaffolding protein [Alkalibacterium sp. f15]|uniref:phage scaffolding protein n=1 Tax=Alkalibacterium sp. f15 TaxID=3414029 RepID=UPI003BF91824